MSSSSLSTVTSQLLLTCMLREMPSLSASSSDRFLVPSAFLRVVCASRRVDECALVTLATDEIGQCILKYTTPSTDTVTESLVKIWTRRNKKSSYDACNGKLQTFLIKDRNCGHATIRERHKFIFTHMTWWIESNVPLVEGCQRTRFSGRLSLRYRCRAEQRKVLERNTAY